MKNLLSLLLMLLVTGFATAAQNSKPENKTEQGILKLEQEWVEALTKNDLAALDHIFHDNLIYTHSSGVVDTKASFIANLKTGNTKYESQDREDVKVMLYGNTALVTCKATVKLISKGQPVTLVMRQLHVYVKEKDRWQMVAYQSTRIQ